MPVTGPIETQGSETLTSPPRTGRRKPLIPLKQNSWFRYWVDPLSVVMRNGVASYLPVRVEYVDGVQNTLDGDEGPSDLYQQRNGRIMVPMDIEVTAWGQKVKGYMVRMHLGQDRLGKDLYHYHDVWAKYEMVGGVPLRAYDYDGWHKFCEQMADVVGAAPHDTVVRGETQRIKTAISHHRRMASKVPGASETADELQERITKPKPRRARTSRTKTEG